MSISKSIILLADSYKYSQVWQYPANTEYVYSYIESRGGEWDRTVFFDLQAFIKEYMLTPITAEDIDVAEDIIIAHGEPFYREGWEHILNEHGGKLPVVIKAVPEGSIIPTHNVLLTIENTDPKCWWLTSFLETALLRAIWYPTTVATNSYESKKIIEHYLQKTGDVSTIDYKLVDFGARGVSSHESASIGGAAHLINFAATDNIAGVLFAREYYGAKMAGTSIPASEHSTQSSWGKEHEVDAYRNMITLFGKPGALFACVSDTYDIYEACKLWGTVLKDDVIGSGATLIVRPDSGEPSAVVLDCIRILETYYGSTVNEQGYRVLNHVRVIQGDGINHNTIRSILACLDIAGYSADNVSFGSGGALLQQVNRDTLKFAMKCSSIKVRVDGELVERDVFKDPVTDHGKRSKRGRVDLFRKPNGEYYSSIPDGNTSELSTVFLNGELVKEYTFDEIRANSRK